MGCSSSALGKAGDSSRFRSATSNECFSPTEDSESCTAQPKPCGAGRELAFPGGAQRGSLPLAEKPKASVMPTANGVRARGSQPLAEDAAPTEKTQPPGGPGESEPQQPGGKDGSPGTEAMKGVEEAAPEVRLVEESAGTDPPGTAENRPPLAVAGALRSPDAPGGDEQPRLPGTPGEGQLGEAGEEATGPEEQAQSQLPEATPQERGPPGTPEGSRAVGAAEEPQRPDAQPQPAERIPAGGAAQQVQDQSRPVLTPAAQDPAHTAPPGPGTPEQVQPGGTVEGGEPPAGVTEVHQESRPAAEEQRAGGKMREKVETEMEEKVNEEAETKEEETGEAMDLSAAT